MIKNTFFITTLCIILSFISRNVHAVYFTIQLKNGNKIKTEKYWEEGRDIRFFIQGGYIRLPNKIIEHIARSDGTLKIESLYYPPKPSEEEQIVKTAPPSTDEQKTDMINDIKDRISVTETNIENLIKNKNTYLSRREKQIKEKDKIQRKIGELNKDSYIPSKDLKERIELQESKIKDIEQKIEQIDVEIKRTEDMLGSQKRMKGRLQTELARLKK